MNRLKDENLRQKTTIAAQNVTLHSLADARDAALAKEKSAEKDLHAASKREEDNSKMAATFREELTTVKSHLSEEQKKSDALGKQMESAKSAAAKALQISEDARHELEKKVQ